jgi:hypothetical protein
MAQSKEIIMFRSKSKLVQDISSAYPKSASFAGEIVNVARSIGTNPYWLANLINFESAGTFSPSITNSLGYTGLIQFGTGASQDLGVTTAYLRSLSAKDQMKYVQKYFELPHKRRGSDYSNPMDLYMAVFYPLGVGKPNYRFPQNVIDANNGIDTPIEYTRRANSSAKLPTGLDATVPYDPNQLAITQKSKTSLSLVPNWVWYISIPLFIGSGVLYFQKIRKK